jgi:hypothetical protein
LALLGMLSLASTAHAQRGGGGGRFGRNISRVTLAGLDQVQAALKLNDDQKSQVTAINDKLRDDRRELMQGAGGGGDFAAMREQLDKLTNDATTQLMGHLDDAQKKRLTELYLQAAGTAALSDADIVAALALTDEQKKQLDEHQTAYNDAVRDAFQQGEDQQARRDRMTALRTEYDEKMMAVLTADQKAKLESLKGEKMELDLSALRGFGGGRRGGRGGGGGGNWAAQ